MIGYLLISTVSFNTVSTQSDKISIITSVKDLILTNVVCMIRPHSWACSSLFHSIYLWTSTINEQKKWWILNQIQSINFQAQNNKFNGQHMQQNSRSFIWCARVCVCVRLSWLKILFFLLLSKAEKSSSMGVANVLDFLDLSLSLSCSTTHTHSKR